MSFKTNEDFVSQEANWTRVTRQMHSGFGLWRVQFNHQLPEYVCIWFSNTDVIQKIQRETILKWSKSWFWIQVHVQHEHVQDPFIYLTIGAGLSTSTTNDYYVEGFLSILDQLRTWIYLMEFWNALHLLSMNKAAVFSFIFWAI